MKKIVTLALLIFALTFSSAKTDELHDMKCQLNLALGGQNSPHIIVPPYWNGLNMYQQIQMLHSVRHYVRFVRSRIPVVGYQPVILILPEGSNFSASVLVSPDRRYVRFSGGFIQSGVSSVQTFSFQSGP